MGSGVAALYASAGSNTSIALGLSYAIVCALALFLVERAKLEAQRSQESSSSVIYSANGLLAQPTRAEKGQASALTSVIRDVSAATALCTALAAVTMETLRFGGLAYPGVLGQVFGGQWAMWQSILGLLSGFGIVVVHVVMDGTLLLTVRCESYLYTFQQDMTGQLRIGLLR